MFLIRLNDNETHSSLPQKLITDHLALCDLDALNGTRAVIIENSSSHGITYEVKPTDLPCWVYVSKTHVPLAGGRCVASFNSTEEDKPYHVLVLPAYCQLFNMETMQAETFVEGKFTNDPKLKDNVIIHTA